MLETLTRRKVGEADRGNMRLHKISNVLKAFSFIESIGIRHQMSAEGNSWNSLHFLIFHFYQMVFFYNMQIFDINKTSLITENSTENCVHEIFYLWQSFQLTINNSLWFSRETYLVNLPCPFKLTCRNLNAYLIVIFLLGCRDRDKFLCCGVQPLWNRRSLVVWVGWVGKTNTSTQFAIALGLDIPRLRSISLPLHVIRYNLVTTFNVHVWLSVVVICGPLQGK